jgi:hypothetical protein
MAGLFSKPNYYAVPQQPTFDTIQKVAIPNYVVKSTDAGSYVNPQTPNTVYINRLEAPSYVNPEKRLNFIKGHELQHQIESANAQQGKTQNDAIERAWVQNSYELGVNPSKIFNEFVNKLSNPEVQKYLEKMGSEKVSRLRNPKSSPLQEILADISGWSATLKNDITNDPFLSKKVFNDPVLKQLVQSTTGMAGVVIGDSDYTPYSLEAAKAWNKQPQTTVEKLQGLFYKDPFGDTTK